MLAAVGWVCGLFGYTLVYRYVVWFFACIIKLVVGLMDNVMDIAKYLIKIIK